MPIPTFKKKTNSTPRAASQQTANYPGRAPSPVTVTQSAWNSTRDFPPIVEEKSKPPPISMPQAAQPSSMASTLLDQKPESVVAETLKMKGELQFNRLLRVDGRFEGDLITNKGSLVVGPTGEVVGDLKNMEEVYVEGIVRGNVCARTVKGVADTASLKERAQAAAEGGTPGTATSTPATGASPSPASTMASNSISKVAPATPPPDVLDKLKDMNTAAPLSTVP